MAETSEAPVGFRQTFTGKNGKVYVYDFDLLEFAQVMHAEAVFSYAQEKLQNPPGRFEDVKMTGGTNWISRAFSHLLIEQLPEGAGFVGYDATRVDRVQEFIEKQLRGDDFKRLMEDCKSDFFDRAGLVDTASLRQLKMQLKPLIELASENPKAMQVLSGNAPAERLNESNDYTEPMSNSGE
ncbi:MAG: hypothetical protein EKK55_24895 [Rhodocyclaceae bacterium]|nr:MAG: hypothetical protein EKK55_24895 [Rhodocyclaceae bacterium]